MARRLQPRGHHVPGAGRAERPDVEVLGEARGPYPALRTVAVTPSRTACARSAGTPRRRAPSTPAARRRERDCESRVCPCRARAQFTRHLTARSCTCAEAAASVDPGHAPAGARYAIPEHSPPRLPCRASAARAARLPRASQAHERAKHLPQREPRSRLYPRERDPSAAVILPLIRVTRIDPNRSPGWWLRQLTAASRPSASVGRTVSER